MQRRNLIGSLAAAIGVLFSGAPLTASPSPSEAAPSASSPFATARVIYANAKEASWEAVTNGGILVAGATPVWQGNAQIKSDAASAIVAAGGPTLSSTQIFLFGGLSPR